MKLSVIVPCYNAENTVDRCLSSLVAQSFDQRQYEIILIDDCSQDSTWQLIQEYARNSDQVVVCATDRNRGCGFARNEGLKRARGDWVVFVDSDDHLLPHALETIAREIDADSDLDVLGFGCTGGIGMPEATDTRRANRQRDGRLLNGSRTLLLTEYLQLRTQACAVFCAVRTQLLSTYQILFRSGIHEDVDYLFRVYLHARRMAYIDTALYVWEHRPGSLSTSVSEQHFRDFLDSWQRIRLDLEQSRCMEREIYLDAWAHGLTAVLATRIRLIFHYARSAEEKAALCNCLYTIYRALFIDVQVGHAKPWTNYQRSAAFFLQVMGGTDLADATQIDMIADHESFLERRSWSCESLAGPVTIRDGRAYACRRSFIHEGCQSGCVVLDEVGDEYAGRAGGSVNQKKQALLRDINAGRNTACDGCPYLEFRQWN